MRLILGDCLDAMRQMLDNSVDLIATDPPYYRVKNEPWDRQWNTPQGFLSWLDTLAEQWQRLLKPNGSLYVFASPKMSAQVECQIGKWFDVIQRITWRKPPFATKAEMIRKEDLRMFFSASEAIIFAEHFGADSIAKGEAGYETKCDELRGFVFEPIRAYLDGERSRAGIDKADCNVACGFSHSAGGMASRHYFSQSQWQLPTVEHYTSLQKLFNEKGHSPAPPYEQYHDAPRSRFEREPSDYDYLRADYENLRRPFTVTPDVPYTDVWDFPTVAHYPGKHPCEKPLELMRHIIRTSSRLGALVMDPMMGNGTTGHAAMLEGRDFLGIEKEPGYFARAEARIRNFQLQLFAEKQDEA